MGSAGGRWLCRTRITSLVGSWGLWGPESPAAAAAATAAAQPGRLPRIGADTVSSFAYHFTALRVTSRHQPHTGKEVCLRSPRPACRSLQPLRQRGPAPGLRQRRAEQDAEGQLDIKQRGPGYHHGAGWRQNRLHGGCAARKQAAPTS